MFNNLNKVEYQKECSLYTEVCNDSYSDEYNIPRIFFFGQCYNCNMPGSRFNLLKRCAGCQLLAYCSKVCQKEHWNNHKFICKAFPVVDGKNILHATGPWKEHIAGLLEIAALLPFPENAKLLLNNPRVCNTCKESRPECLTDCKCASVSFCGKKCAKADKQHKEACRVFSQIGQSYSLCYKEDPIEIRRLVSYSATLWNALKSSCKGLGSDNLPMEDLTTLNLHVVCSSPLFYHDPWDEFIHLFPKLKQLNIVFIMQASASKSLFNLNFRLSGLSLLRCDDCKAKNRVITYSVQKMLYHMFFSSPQYTEPDVVVVYGNSYEMSACDDDINNKMSYRNMAHSQDTVLVLTDETEDLLKQGTNAVNALQTVDKLGPVMKNPFRKLPTNDHAYYICLKKSVLI